MRKVVIPVQDPLDLQLARRGAIKAVPTVQGPSQQHH